MNVSGPWYASTLWPPSTTFQVTDSPAVIWLVVFDGSFQSIVTLAADAGEATASALAPASARGMNFFMGTAALLEWDRTREQAFPASASARARLFVQVRQPSSSRSPSG